MKNSWQLRAYPVFEPLLAYPAFDEAVREIERYAQQVRDEMPVSLP